MDVPTLVDAQEVAARLGVSAKHIYDLAAEHTIPSFRIGRLIRFDLAKVFAALEDQ